MKKFLLIALLMTSTAAFAADDHATERAARRAAVEKRHEEHQDARFTHEKAERQNNLSRKVTNAQKHLSCLQTVQSCVSAASDMKTLNNCHKDCD